MSTKRFAAPLVVVCALLGALAFTAAPALATGATITAGSESVSDAGSSSVVLSAQVSLEGPPGTYYFEYGPTSDYGSHTPAYILGASGGTVGTPATLEGLQASTEYHFRVVVENNKSVAVKGEDAVFTTLPAVPQGLPDGRFYEMVTPVDNQDADAYVPQAFNPNIAQLDNAEGIHTKLPFQASADGQAMVYPLDPTNTGVGVGGNGLGNEQLARRLPDGGWSQSNLQPPSEAAAFYQAFSSDLMSGILDSGNNRRPNNPVLADRAPGGGYKVMYKRNMNATTESIDAYMPLFSVIPPDRSIDEFEAAGVVNSSLNPELAFAGGSVGWGDLLFEANDALTAGAVDGGASVNNLYDSAGGRLRLVNVLPDGASEPNATFGSGGSFPDFSNVISESGDRVFWTDENTGDLYVSENIGEPDQATVQVDKAVGGGGRFWTASSDGSRVFFTKGDLYEYEAGSGQTTNLTPGVEVEGLVGASQSGNYIYYVDYDGSTESDNLNVLHFNGTAWEAPVFIAGLSPEDGNKVDPFYNIAPGGGTAFGDWLSDMGYRTAEVSPGGGSVVFMSDRSLSTFPGGKKYANGGLDEVFVFDAEEGRLFCVSCNRSGEAPESNALSSQGAAAFLPVSWSNTYLPQWMSDDGSRVFFDSDEPLVSQDKNGKQDVYEWERDGSGSCTESAGCIYLLSGGTSQSASWLIGASASGDDVFIVTRAQLVPEDGNDAYDVYDVHAGGVQPVVPSGCTGTGCQGVPASPPVFATPSSVTFEGVGNFPAPAPEPAVHGKARPLTRAQQLAKALKACRKKPHRAARTSCERTARKTYSPTKPRRK